MSDRKIIFYKLSFWKKLFIPKMILLLFKLNNKKSFIYVNNLKQLERISLNNSDKIITWGNKYKNELEIFKNRFVNGKTLFYVCKNNTCELPIEDFNLLINKLKS